MSRLKELLIDLGQDADVYQEYIKEPQAVMTRYALTEEESRAMLARDLGAVKRLSGMSNLVTNHTIKAHDG